MQASIESLGSLERRLSVNFPLGEVDAEVETRLKRLARTVRIHGFRPGKVPLRVVEAQFGGQVRQEVLGDAVQKTFGEAVREKNLRVAGFPRIELKSADTGSGTVEYTATFEIYPEVSIGDLGHVRIERPVVAVGEAEVDKTLEILRKQRTTYHATDSAAAIGDQIRIDYRGTIEGNEFEGGSGQGQYVLLGESRLLPDFENNVVGLRAGESKTFALRFPDDYHHKEVAGKSATFEVKVSEVHAARVPALDAEFAKALGIEDGDLGRMREEVKANLEREIKRRVAARLKDQVMKALTDNVAVELPKALVDMEVERLAHNMRHDLQARGLKTDKVPLPREAFEAEAKRRVQLGLIVAELVRLRKLEARPEQVKAVVQEFARSYEKPEEVVRWYYQQPERLRELESVVLEDNVVQWMLGNAKVEDKVTSFDELMGNTQ
ncbi:MAG TPA: trigger factor [Burkholderiales bacterium]|nr:trigger factor [Burkholderiales bacterium]